MAISPKLQRSVSRFRERIKNGSYYEAQQTVRAVANRYVNAGKLEEAGELLYQSAMILVEYKKYDEASDLYLYMLECDFKEDKVYNFLESLPDSDANMPNLAVETSKVVKEKTGKDVGVSRLNELIGTKLYYSGDAKAVNESQRFLYTSSGDKPIELLVSLFYGTYKKQNAPDTFGVYVANLVIPFLLLRRTAAARTAVDAILEKEGKASKTVQDVKIIDEASDSAKLVDFVQLLVATCERPAKENADNIKRLFSRYQRVIEDVPSLVQAVDQVSSLYFGVNLVAKQQNLLRDMMGSFLGGN